MNKLSVNGAIFIRLHEGFVSKWYLDPVGVPTIGIGFTWRSDSFREWWTTNKPGRAFVRGATMTRNEADRCVMYLVNNEYGKAVNNFLGEHTKVPQHVFDGMVSPVYNLGPGSLDWKWAAAAKNGDYKRSAELLRVTGTTAGGKRLAGLVRRREEEALLISRGIYTGVVGGAPREIEEDVAMSDGILRRGEAGPSVEKLIQDLFALGYYKGVLDDLFGYGTEQAVLSFQRDASLTADGLVGPETLAALDRELDHEPVVIEPEELTWFERFLKSLFG